MSAKRTALTEALFDVIVEAPADELAALHIAFNDYTEAFPRTVRRAPPLLRALLDAIDEATDLAIDDDYEKES